jgi:hypothetical protein
MTGAQRRAVRAMLQSASELHHGDCIGSDADSNMAAMLENAHRVFTEQGRLHQITIWIHPPEDNKYRAYCNGHVWLSPKPYLERNADIVDMLPPWGKVIATPRQTPGKEPQGYLRGEGTWWTVRYALNANRVVSIIWPDGTTEVRKP